MDTILMLLQTSPWQKLLEQIFNNHVSVTAYNFVVVVDVECARMAHSMISQIYSTGLTLGYLGS